MAHFVIYEDENIRYEAHISETWTVSGLFFRCAERWSDGNLCHSVFYDTSMHGIAVCSRAFYKQGSVRLNFVCDACAKERHDDCQGDTWCDCQHRKADGEHSG